MAYVARGNHQKVISTGVKSFKERTTALQEELKECYERQQACEQGIQKAKATYHTCKPKAAKKRLRMQEIDVRLEKIEIHYRANKEKLWQQKRRTQDNLERSKSLEGSQPDLEDLVKEIHQANHYAVLMKQKKNGAAKQVEGLEEKIQKAENRFARADDKAYTIMQKIETHRHLLGNPEVTTNYKPKGKVEITNTVNSLREKIRNAAIRTRQAEQQAAHLDKRIEVMDQAIENYDRRIADFEQNKREIMGSKF